MSFGFSPSDIISLVSFVAKTYHAWKTSCGDYADVVASLDSLLIILERVQDEAKQPHTCLVRSKKDRDALNGIVAACRSTIKELNTIIKRYQSLGLGKSREKNWDRIRFGTKNLDSLRTKLLQHESALAAYLNAVGLSSLSRIERHIDALPDRIQQTVDSLAAEIRAGRREGSIMTTYEDDEKVVWKQFRRELIGDGMRSSFVHKYKPQIRKYLRSLADKGLLEEAELPLEDESSLGSPLTPSSSRAFNLGILESSQAESPHAPMSARYNSVPEQQEAGYIADGSTDSGDDDHLSTVSLNVRNSHTEILDEVEFAQSAAPEDEVAVNKAAIPASVDEECQISSAFHIAASIPKVNPDVAPLRKPYQATCESCNSSDEVDQDQCPDDVIMVERVSNIEVEQVESAPDLSEVNVKTKSKESSRCSSKERAPSIDRYATMTDWSGESGELSGVSEACATVAYSNMVEGLANMPRMSYEARMEFALRAQASHKASSAQTRSGSPPGAFMKRLDMLREETADDWPPVDDEDTLKGQKSVLSWDSDSLYDEVYTRDSDSLYGEVYSSDQGSGDHLARAGTPPSIMLERLEMMKKETVRTWPPHEDGPRPENECDETDLKDTTAITKLPKNIFSWAMENQLGFEFRESDDHYYIYHEMTEESIASLLEVDESIHGSYYTWTRIEFLSYDDSQVLELISQKKSSADTYWVKDTELGPTTWLSQSKISRLHLENTTHVIDRRVENYIVLYGFLDNREIRTLCSLKQQQVLPSAMAHRSQRDARTKPFIITVEGYEETRYYEDLTMTWFPKCTFNMWTMLALGRVIEQQPKHYLVRGKFTADELEGVSAMNDRIISKLARNEPLSEAALFHLQAVWADDSFISRPPDSRLFIWLCKPAGVWTVCGPFKV